METGNPALHMRFCFGFFRNRDSQLFVAGAMDSIPVEMVMLFFWMEDMSFLVLLLRRRHDYSHPALSGKHTDTLSVWEQIHHPTNTANTTTTGS